VEQSAGSNRFQRDLWRRSEWVGNEPALHLGRNEAGFSATRGRGRICQEDRLARQNAGSAPDFLEKHRQGGERGMEPKMRAERELGMRSKGGVNIQASLWGESSTRSPFGSDSIF
jgi:hypothetical protein